MIEHQGDITAFSMLCSWRTIAGSVSAEGDGGGHGSPGTARRRPGHPLRARAAAAEEAARAPERHSASAIAKWTASYCNLCIAKWPLQWALLVVPPG